SCQTAPGQRSLRDRSCQLPRPISRSRPPDDRCLYLVEKWAKVICSDDDTRACLRGTATLGQGCFVLLLAPRFSGVSSSSGEGHMPSTANRRRFLKGMGAGALASGIGSGIVVPERARAARKTLKILHWVHFVPAYDEWFNERYVKEWGEKNDTDVIVDNIHLAGVSARAVAEI